MPSVEKVTAEILPRDWGQEIIFANTPTYLGKLLAMKAGTKGGLQRHVEKVETFCLIEGIAIVRWDKGDGLLQADVMRRHDIYHVPAGAVHQVEAVTDCLFVEASTPHFNDRVRCESEYGLPDDGGLPTTSKLFIPGR